MKPLLAVLDANVLFPQLLRDVLLSLSFNGIYAARWSDRITTNGRAICKSNGPICPLRK